MKVKNRLSPYPILFDYRDDYLQSSFQADISAAERFNDIIVNVAFHLKDKVIEELIRTNQARFLLHIECPAMSLRKSYETEEDQFQISLPMDDVCEKLEICTFIVASKDIKGYSNPQFHSDYQGLTFDLSKGQLVAIGTSKQYDIEKNADPMASLPSIIKIMRNNSKVKGTITVNTDSSDYIYIGLSQEAFDLYARLGKHVYAKTVLSLVLLPAMITVLDRIREEADSFQDARWFTVLEELLERNGYTVDQLSLNDSDDSVLSIAQAIFSNPVQNSLRELDAAAEGEF